ncbi:MAG TPA: hypothetical protein VGH28_22860 [Polyangiaceae bacterium]|jgi:hypothetical protein
MRWLRWVPLAALGLACSSSSDGPIALAPSIVFPAGLLDGVTELKISVYDGSGSLDCNDNDGTVKGLNGDVPLATTDLGTSNCAGGAKFCGNISINKSDSPRLFAAQAFVGNDSAPRASGCTKATPNQDALLVKITMLRTLPPQTCNGTPSTIITQCDTGGPSDPVCDASCQSLEDYLSKGDGTTTSDASPKTRPELAWPAASGDGGRMLAFWGEKVGCGNEVSMRVLDDHMEPYTGGSLEVQQGSFRMPTIMGNAPGAGGGPCGQFNPTAASINGSYYVAFEDTSTGPTAIKIRTLDSLLLTQQTSPVAVSDASSNAQTVPSMAANGNKLFVAWESQGSIFGKTVDSALTPGTQASLGTGTAVSVAATSSGWVAVWQNGTDVEMSHIDASGAPGAATKVNDAAGATHASVAAFGANVAVVWLDGNGHIVTQRFDASANKIAGDQTNFLEAASLGGNQTAPSVAAGTNFFVATWVDSASGHVRARFLDGAGGFLYNWVTGQNGDFQVSTVDGHQRNTPVAVVGGAGAFVSIAWEDDDPSPGIWARRFPLPQQ